MKFYHLSLLFFLIAYTSCSSNKAIVSDETATKIEVTKNYPSFFNAENARVMGNTKKALELYTEYVKNDKDNATAFYNLARLQLQKSDSKNAEKNAAFACKLDPENKYFQEFYTQLLVINKKDKQAEAQYDILIKKYPQDDEYLYDKAILQVITKQYDKAINSFNALEKSMGFSEDIIIQKKNIFILQGKKDLAIGELEKLKQNDISSPKYDIIIADIYESDKQTEKVAKVYDHIEQTYPNDPVAQVALAQYYQGKKNTNQYNHYMQLIMKNKNLDVETKIALMIPALKSLDTDTAEQSNIINMAKSVSEESAGNKDAVSLYADVLYFSKKYDDALVEYKKYLTLDKNKFSIWSQIISIYSEKQQSDSVLQISKQCIGYFPKNAIPYFYAGVTHLQKKELDSAITYLSNGLPFDKENKLLQSQFYSSLGDAYNTQKKYVFSDSCFEQAIALQPSDATALNNYAYYLSLRKDHLDIAEKMSKKSLELVPASKSFLDTYGWILFQQGNYKEAITYIQKAIDSNGQDDGTLLEHLGDVYYHLGELNKAKENWKKAKEKGETNPTLLKKIQDGKYYE